MRATLLKYRPIVLRSIPVNLLEDHLSLMRLARQFSDPGRGEELHEPPAIRPSRRIFDRYPRALEGDMGKLEKRTCTIQRRPTREIGSPLRRISELSARSSMLQGAQKMVSLTNVRAI